MTTKKTLGTFADNVAKGVREAILDAGVNQALGLKSGHADFSSPGGHGRTFEREPEEAGIAADQEVGGGRPGAPRGNPTGRRHAASGDDAHGYDDDPAPQTATVAAYERLSDELEGLAETVKALIQSQAKMQQSQAKMAKTFAELLRKASEEEDAAGGDLNHEPDADEEDAEQAEEGEDEEDRDNQKTWAEAEKARRDAQIREVLAGQKILRANLAEIANAISGRGSYGDMATSDSGLYPKSNLRPPPYIAPYGPTKTSAELAKSRNWYSEKAEEIAEREDSGAWGLEQVMSAQNVLSAAQAYAAGHVHKELLKSRVQSADPDVRQVFQDLLAALED